MKRKIKLDDGHLQHIIKEAVYNVLTENKEINYYEILQNEYAKAQHDVEHASTTFHGGIRNYLLLRGYIVTSYADNWIHFYGPSRLFKFYAHQNYEDYRRPWILTNHVELAFSNYTWKQRYQYPNYYHNLDYKEIKIEDFPEFYEETSEEIGEPLILKPFKTKYETIKQFNKFIVYETGGRYPDKKLAEFDNFEEAKEAAHRFAEEECIKGKRRNDSTSRNYHSFPKDVTKDFTMYAAAYEYYNYDEHDYCIVVWPTKTDE